MKHKYEKAAHKKVLEILDYVNNHFDSPPEQMAFLAVICELLLASMVETMVFEGKTVEFIQKTMNNVVNVINANVTMHGSVCIKKMNLSKLNS